MLGATAADLKLKISGTYMPIFQSALFYSIATQLTEVFVAKRPDSTATLMLCIAIYLGIVLVISVTLEKFKAQLPATPNQPLLLFLATFASHIAGLVATLLTQLESTLVSRLAFNIFDEASSVGWAVAIGVVATTLLFLARMSAFNSFT